MHSAQPPRVPKVLDLDRNEFDATCKKLMELVLTDWRPDVLIGIRSGGLYVAEAMGKACPFHIPIHSITCRRPTTRFKTASATLRGVIAELPRPVLDQLRVLEHRLITQRAKHPKPGERQLDAAELEVLDHWLTTAGDHPSLLIVDDSVDSGVTMAIVRDAIRRRSPAGAEIRCATITVTTPQPSIIPDYVLFHQQLCRFPWSLDAQLNISR
ncbi:MAG: hypothetical protein EPO08_18645 [Rhodospirillaceae bacterium]|nr:MAG: hypothetical protein EPO08_18645 [Rhodospirillaceae bacterium]